MNPITIKVYTAKKGGSKIIRKRSLQGIAKVLKVSKQAVWAQLSRNKKCKGYELGVKYEVVGKNEKEKTNI